MSIYHDILKKYWNYNTFRDPQEDIIKSVCEGRDTLALMPTGGGKSITFQVPAIAMEGLCIVITPLIALMKDQVINLKKKGIRAAAIYSGMSHQEILTTLDNCTYGDFKLLYISPERLTSNLFITRIKQLKISMIAVDEAHCISQWGYDFRPSYLNIAEIRNIIPEAPVLALTATATQAVAEDIQKILKFRKGSKFFRKSFERKNLAYIVRKTENKEKELINILTKVKGSGIIYVRSRKATMEISKFLINNKISSDYYHAGLTNETKDKKQENWKTGKIRIISATNAFGMGIDKPDVRIVIHIDIPDSIEAYFQEAGRAGRDGKKAYAILLYNNTDISRLKKNLSNSFPPKETIRNIYESLCFYYEMGIGKGKDYIYKFDLTDFCKKFHYSQFQAFSSLKILSQAGYIEYTDTIGNLSKVRFNITREELYNLSVDRKTENLIQTILRSYTGVFTGYIPIQEELIASRLNTERDEIYQSLLCISRMGILNYRPRSKTPYIIFSKSREEKDRICISKLIYEDCQKRAGERINSIIDYATDNQTCRSRKLLLYFGEKNTENCKKCDYCLSKSKLNIKNHEFDAISNKILKALKNKPESFEKLIDNMDEKEKAIKVLRFMLDNNVIKYNDKKNVFFI